MNWIPEIAKLVIASRALALSLTFATGIFLLDPTRYPLISRFGVIPEQWRWTVLFIFALSLGVNVYWFIQYILKSLKERQYFIYLKSILIKIMQRLRKNRNARIDMHHALTNLSADEVTFLGLFRSGGNHGNHTAHGLLPYSVYAAHFRLRRINILESFSQQESSAIEIFKLSELAQTMLRKTLFKGEYFNNKICLDLRFVSGSGVSGGGAPPCGRV